MESHEGRAFTFGARIGEGGFGEVYRGSMCSVSGLETEVAIKILHRDLNPESQALQRLKDEGKLLARLNHPNILFVHDLIELGGRWSLITEFIDGDDLNTLCESDPPLPAGAIVSIIGQIASALDAAWSTPGKDGPLHLIHRDIKPSNIRISRYGHVKLLDFGIARADDDREAKTRTNLVIGSPPYMAPERYLTDKCDASSDIFSLGATLFESLTRERLFSGKSALNIGTLSLDDELFMEYVTERLEHPAVVQGALAQLLAQMLAYEPSQRPSATDVANRVDDIIPMLKDETLKQWSRKHRWSRVSTPTGHNDALKGQTFSERPSTATNSLTTFNPDTVHDNTTMSDWVAHIKSRPFQTISVVTIAAVLTMTIGAASGFGGLMWWKQMQSGSSVQNQSILTPPVIIEEAPDELPFQDTDEPVLEDVDTPQPAKVTPTKRIQRTTPRSPAAKTPTMALPAVVNTDAEAPITEEPVTARISTSSDLAVSLTSGGHTYTLPADVPFGTYTINAAFSQGQHELAGTLTVSSATAQVIACKQLFRRCEAQ